MEIYLIRHTSVDIPAGYAYGQTDVPLNLSFEQEANLVQEKLASVQFDAVFTSPLSRATKLASFCGFPDATKDHRLLELNFGEWEMKSWQEISDDSRSKEWFANWQTVKTPKGESLQMQYERISDFLDQIKNLDAKKIALFTHGGIISLAQVYTKAYSLEEAFKHIPAFGEIVQINL